jgi:hypothetical protein
MSWDLDIEEWSQNNQRDAETVSGICVRKGWEPEKYLPSMKKQLFDWLDQWYTLSIKKLPPPATASRRNPGPTKCPLCREKIIFLRRLGNGMMLGSCGDSFHDSGCECDLCGSFDIMN